MRARLVELRAQAFLAGALALSPLFAGASVHYQGVDRNLAGDTVACIFFASLLALLSTPWWLRDRPHGPTRADRVQSTVLIWCVASYAIHLTWELLWLLLHEPITTSPDALWTYPWWAYIDGGDARYATADPTLVGMEILSVLNGLVGVTGLLLFRRRPFESTLLLMATAVVHLYSASLYFLTETLDGFPNVDTSSFVDLVIKFWLLNGVWLVMPLVVLRWGAIRLMHAPPSS